MAPHLARLDEAITDAISGRGLDRLLVSMPPRHGKSELLCKYLPAWYLGTFPDRRVILTSHTASLAHRMSASARNVFAEHGRLFGERLSQDSAAKADWSVRGREGGLFSCGVDGSVTGRGANLIIVDDPHNGAQDAESLVMRNRVWQWYTEELYSRQNFGEAVIIVIQTRWHEDDLTGRLLEASGGEGDQWRHIMFPALAETADSLGRQPGEALWPKYRPQDFLLRQRATLGARAFSAQFQQRPMPLEGGMFQKRWFRHPELTLDTLPEEHVVGSAVRYWDLAYSDGAGDWTCGALLVDLGPAGRVQGRLAVADVQRAQLSGHERTKLILETAESDRKRLGHKVKTYIEQDGNAGKEVVQQTIRALAGHSVRAVLIGSKGSKTFRADPFAAQCEAGNVRLVHGGKWHHAFLEELAHFPFGKHDDQVDAIAGAFSMLPKPGAGQAPETVEVGRRERFGVGYKRTENPRRFIKQ